MLDGTVKRFEIGWVGFDKVDSKDPRQNECLAKMVGSVQTKIILALLF